jgi:hypothetical protein
VSRQDVGYPSAWVVSVAAILAVLPGAAWLVSLLGLLLLRGGSHAMFSHPLGLLRGGVTAALWFVAAWLIEQDRWSGAVLAAAMFTVSALATAGRHQWRLSFGLVLPLVGLAFAVSAFRLLHRYKRTEGLPWPSAKAVGG